MPATRKTPKLRTNDANLCRLKGWGPGTVLTINYYDEPVPNPRLLQRWRITAVGDTGILVRELTARGLRPEKHWSNKLVRKYVEAVEQGAADAR